ncbi:MAG TPA: hypothetical protein DDX39_10225 [Bacteroidales bacterium]|nr:MAG: hypothetical protein A2W98_04460 [Bacteroidetes bacterium GWF2_33_38]HBF89005.1 hypothetical protein [Bacteroidales bacterium]
MNTLQHFKNIPFKIFPILLIVLYVPFHLFEEAYFNFPFWMFEHYNLPKPLSYEHWLINNSFFFIVLLIGLILFLINKSNNLFIGFGILIWGFMNSMEHILFSILDLQLSPGFFTAIFFLIIFGLGLLKLLKSKLLNLRLVIKSILIAAIYWIIPIIVIIMLGSHLVKAFPFN